MMASLCAWHGSIIVQARIQKTHLHTWYLSFFLHAHILSHENFTLRKCVNLQQNCQKQYFYGCSGIFLHSDKIFTLTPFTAFMTNIRYAHLVPWDGQRRTWDTNHQNGIETSRSSFRMKGNIWSCPIVKYQKMLLLLVMVLVILWEVEETDMAGGRSFTGWRIHLRMPHVPPYSKHTHTHTRLAQSVGLSWNLNPT